MAWILDIIFFVVLLLGCFIGAKVGLVKGVCKISGWVLSIVIPLLFCVAFKDALENWFGMVSAISNGIGNAKIADWLSVGIAFILLAIIVRLGTYLLGKIGTALVEGVKPMKVVNGILGALLGIIEAFLVVYFILLILSWLSIDSVNTFIDASTVVGAIYRSDLMGHLSELFT